MSTIINVRGTHGSGKSTVVRRVLEQQKYVPQMVYGRLRPFAYKCENGLYVLGSYENECGGVDNLGSYGLAGVFEAVKVAADAGMDVLFEGIMQSMTRLVELHKVHPVTVIALTTPIEQCIESVMSRRAGRGQTGEFDPKNVYGKHRAVVSATKNFRHLIPHVDLDREEAFNYCMRSFQRCAA